MSGDTNIEWTDHTFNPWWGCFRLEDSPACDNCYARRIARRFYPGEVEWRRLGNRHVTASETYWEKPSKWNRQAARDDEVRRVFCLSMGDFFEDHPYLWEARARTYDLMRETPNLQWLILTKRPENWEEIAPPGCALPDNVGVGVTVENQEMAEKRIPKLLEIPTSLRFVSCEPLLGNVSLERYLVDTCDQCGAEKRDWQDRMDTMCPFSSCGPMGSCDGRLSPSVDWVIAGGESGPDARPSHPAWFRSLRDQCQAADVPFFFKQWGAWMPAEGDPAEWAENERPLLQDGTDCRGLESWADSDYGCVKMKRMGKKAAGRKLDGETWNQFPEDSDA